MTGSTFGSVTIRAEHDAATELSLSPPKCHMLEFIAAHGSEVPFTWDSFEQRKRNAKSLLEAQTCDDAREGLVDLINAKYIREVDVVGLGGSVLHSFLQLTDKGKSVVAELQKYKLVPESMKQISAQEIAQEMQKP